MRILLEYAGKAGNMPLIQWAYPILNFIEFSKKRRKTKKITEANS